MDEEIDFYLLSSFNETVEKAQAAIDTAQDADNTDMLKAAQGLLKEGERARKAIDTIARRQLALYGQNFIDAIKDHGKQRAFPRTLSCSVPVRETPARENAC